MDRLRKDKVAVICAGIVLLFILVAVFAPLLAKLEGQDYGTFHTDLVDEFGFPTTAPTRRTGSASSRRPAGTTSPAGCTAPARR